MTALAAAFSGARSGDAPLTWGQRAIWEAIERTAPDDHYFNFGRIVQLGARPASVSGALWALARLVERHESLRTRIVDGRQALAAAGELTVVLGADPDALLAELTATAFDYAREWPLRVGLVTTGAEVTHIVLAFCHHAADGLGAEEAVRDLRLLLLRGEPRGSRPPQPLDIARWQSSPEGRRVAEEAAWHWEREHRRIPPTMFQLPSGAGESPPIWRAVLRSPAVDLAAQRIAVQHGTSTSNVLLTAVTALVAEMTGHETVAMLPIVSNRFRADTRGAVSTLSQEGLFVLDVEKVPFAELLALARPAALRAYRSAYHDPADRARVLAEVGEDRGTPVHPWCCFNDMRFADHAVYRDDALIRRALGESSLSWPMSQEQLNCRFCVHVSGTMEVSVTADTRWLSRADMERFLRGLEDRLVEAALR
ncbi:condensation domain-containing protein [Acrocarpospora catenulata]|uniref:condensation domain-containing protein n=1 Tax=Acrocarpospora catenulata TaxID=2836182 RepID=UPI001BD96517|nr:condensation domain-containing protein [Acrocarpospora catenulata]